MSHRTRHFVPAYAAALAVVGGLAAAAPAQAVTVERSLSCNLPLIGPQPATLTINADLPSTAPPGGTITGNFDWTIELRGDAWRGFRTMGVSSYEIASPRLPVDLALAGSATSSALLATGTSAPTPLSEEDPGEAAGVPLAVDGQLTPKALPGEAGDAKLSLRSTLNFQVLAKDANGDLIEDEIEEFPDTPLEEPPGLAVSCKLATGADPVIHTFKIVPPPAVPPTNVNAVPAGTTADLTWSSAEPNVSTHVVQCGVALSVSTTEPRVTLTNLEPGKTYNCEVWTINAAGQRSASTSVTFTTVPAEPETKLSFGLTGATTLKSLATGTVPLTGKLDATVGLGGLISGGQLALDPAQAKLKALGFVPVTAKLQFVPVGVLTGSTGDVNFSTPWVEQAFRIKLPDVRVYGIQIGGGQNCQTRSATRIKLTAGGPLLSAPQTLTGTYSLSNLSGCGALNGLVSQVTSSTGNLMRLSLQDPANA